MQRVPVDLVVLTLTQSGITATPRQIRNWTYRGHITHTREGYDLGEVLAYLDNRGRATNASTRRTGRRKLHKRSSG